MKRWGNGLGIEFAPCDLPPVTCMRLAFFSPLNPAPSGISDYSEELLPYLAPYADIELIVDGFVPSNPALAQFPVRTVAEFYERASRYDVVVYQMGNSPAHAAMYEAIPRVPGVVVMHDIVLHHLRAWLTLERGKRGEYVAAMKDAYGDEGEAAANTEIHNSTITDRFEFPLNEEIVRSARALIVHSQYAADQIRPLAPATPLKIIPMGIEIPPLVSKDAARRALGLQADAFIVAAFGEIHPYKRVLPALGAFAEFRARHPNALFLFVGRASPLFDVNEAARELGVADAVRIIGYAPREEYENYIAAADVCLNLRYPTAGETSASLLRMLAAGKLTFVTRVGSAAELPDEVCVKIEPDAHEQSLLAAYLDYFGEHPDAGAVYGANARRYVEQHHTLEGAAREYVEFLRRVVEIGD